MGASSRGVLGRIRRQLIAYAQARHRALRVPHEVDGSRAQFRAPRTACLLKASNDDEARLNAA
ncbi:hypothetical protein DF156_07140 [Burkholderia ubonensis]|uniref:Uncharacterized protein n=1 Tax=Burkholderia ubonensis TaxID=101571 RepID=A0AB74D5X8_9BURK|nr:hypothetical protein CJO71_08045 [Burkholderia ubonensis]PAJ89427.1 hypothetical protein CJO70_02800 [Burkholderia ubonensis]PAJ95900.1 hypothetical protein CJO69_04200 [Burkholderia ubonensis]PAK01028.1 hypothetical protein CJO68_10695 [Burkholderia ubonensis]PAK03516.1 hypothetical protein CJO67_34685 [Burkholderia ubonensis]